MAAGPTVLAEVLRKAIADGKDELAAVAATALGQVTDRARLAATGHPQPAGRGTLGSGPACPVRRRQGPGRAGSDRGHFPAPAGWFPPWPGSRQPEAAPGRGHRRQLEPGQPACRRLKTLGYEPVLETSAIRAFAPRPKSADVELVAVSHAPGAWRWSLIDILTNLRSDARTANLPVYIVRSAQPRARSVHSCWRAFQKPGSWSSPPAPPSSRASSVVGPRTHRGRTYRAMPAKRRRCWPGSPGSPGVPYVADLAASEPALTIALNQPETSLAAATALGEAPNADAQQSLADVVLDPSRPAELRRTATELAHSIHRFGPLVSADQEAQLAAESRTNPILSSIRPLGTVVSALRAKSPTPADPAMDSPRGPPVPPYSQPRRHRQTPNLEHHQDASHPTSCFRQPSNESP